VAKALTSGGILPPPSGGGSTPMPGLFDYGGGGGGDYGAAPAPAAPSGGGGFLDMLKAGARGALGGKPVTMGNVTSAITGGDGSLGDIAKLLATLGIGAAGLKAGHDAGKNAHELTGRQLSVGNDLADFGRQSLASANTFRDAAQGPLLLRLNAGPAPAGDMSQFRDTLNPYRKRYGTPLLPPPGGA